MQIMSKFICFVLCAVAASVHTGEEGPASMINVTEILVECGNEHGITIAELEAVKGANDVKIINSCVWGCTLKKTGFLDDKGQYVLNPGLAYVKNITKVWNDEAYTNLENIAKQCESVKDKAVSDGEAGCEMGALVVACFLESFEQSQRKRSFSKG